MSMWRHFSLMIIGRSEDPSGIGCLTSPFSIMNKGDMTKRAAAVIPLFIIRDLYFRGSSGGR